MAADLDADAVLRVIEDAVVHQVEVTRVGVQPDPCTATVVVNQIVLHEQPVHAVQLESAQ